MRFKKFFMLISVALTQFAFAYGNEDNFKEPISFLTDKKAEKFFWEQSNYNFFQIKNQINLISNTIMDSNLENELQQLSHHLTQKNIAYDDNNAYRFKNFLFNKKQYTAINLVSGASAPVGTLFLINNNKINFSGDLGQVVSIETSKTQSLLSDNQLLIKTRLIGGTGSYHLSGIILNQDKDVFKKIAAYPIHGFINNPGIYLEYRVKRLPSDKNTLKFFETIFLVDNTKSTRQELGFNKSLKKEFVVLMRNQNNKFTLVDNPSYNKDPAFKVFEEVWRL